MSAFQLPSLTDLLSAINAANGTSFLVSDLSFSNPKVVAGTWQGLSSDRNTAIKVTAASAGYQGSVVILYNRLDLGSLANLSGIQNLAVNNPTHTWDILPQLAFFTGIQFAQTDLQNLPITLNGDGTGQVQLSADPNSLGWQGSVMLNVVPGGVTLDSAVTVPALPGLNYPVADNVAPPASAVYGPAYLYPYDFTTYQPTFLTYAPGAMTQTQLDYVLAAIQALDVGAGKASWVDTGSNTTYNLTGATIVSNGLNNPTVTPTNPAYKYVMAIQLAAGVTVPAGMLYLHYNDPFDPNNF
ncbi:hypothetical protein [Burkholderia phage FLC9]|nr:hypothetical protein [Burkholderia phage FLC9]